MSVMQEELGRRIRAAREACRMTQEQVAERLGVVRPTVAQIEAGKRSVSSLELDRLAHLFGRDIREFVAESFEESDTLAALFRAEPDVVEQPAVADALRDCVALGREITNLERLLGVERGASVTAAYALPAPATRWEAIQQGERLATGERRRLGLGDAALAHHFGVSRLAALYRLRNLRLLTDAEFDRLKGLDEAGKGKLLAERMGLSEPDHAEVRNWFRERYLVLALEAYRREAISRGKLTELGARLGLSRDEIDQLIEDGGLGGHPPAARQGS